MLSELEGASSFLKGSIVTYADDMKAEFLNIDNSVLREHGSVSNEVAKLMVKFVQKKSKSDLAVSITGIAGPDGGTPNKPVGTVYIGFYFDNKIHVKHFVFSGNRQEIRLHAIDAACVELLKLIQI